MISTTEIRDVIDVRSPRAIDIAKHHFDRANAKDPQVGQNILKKIEKIIGSCDSKNSQTLFDYIRDVRFHQAADADKGEALSPEEQNILLIGMFMALDIDAGLHLAVHLYLSLIRGTSTAKLAHTLRVAQIYVGLSSYTAAIRTLSETLRVLETYKHYAGDPPTMLDKLDAHFGLTY